MFSGKGNILKIVHRVWKVFENRVEIWNGGGKCVMVSEGMDAPELTNCMRVISDRFATRKEWWFQAVSV